MTKTWKRFYSLAFLFLSIDALSLSNESIDEIIFQNAKVGSTLKYCDDSFGYGVLREKVIDKILKLALDADQLDQIQLSMIDVAWDRNVEKWSMLNGYGTNEQLMNSYREKQKREDPQGFKELCSISEEVIKEWYKVK